jgi:hypothetical protein
MRKKKQLDIWSATQPLLLRALSEQARPFTEEVPSPIEEEVPPMSNGDIQDRLLGGELRCEFERTLNGEYCTENAEVRLDGLLVCERHAGQLRLEERVAYWRAI